LKAKRRVGRPISVGATEDLVIGISPQMKQKMKQEAKKRNISTSELTRRCLARFLRETALTGSPPEGKEKTEAVLNLLAEILNN